MSTCATPIDLPAPSGYKPQGSGLISRGFGNEVFSGALSLAANRASKIAKLVAGGHTDLAARFQADLRADCAAFLDSHPEQPDGFAQRLAAVATPEAVTAPPARFPDGAPVRMANGITGTLAHTYPLDGERMWAVTVTRTSEPPHPRHGARWSEQWHANQSRLSQIDPSEVVTYPADDRG